MDDQDAPRLCACGCGQPVTIGRGTAGKNRRFVHGHHARLRTGEKSSQWKGGVWVNRKGRGPELSTVLCACGCGSYTHIATQADKDRGVKKGDPYRYLPGHQNRGRKRKAETEPEERRLSEHPCECGCGRMTYIATTKDKRYGHTLGAPLPYLKNHLNNRRRSNPPLPTPENPPLCACGCGQPVHIPDHNDKHAGYVRGVPMTFVHGHAKRVLGNQFGPPRQIGQKQVTPAGYVQVYRPDHPNAPLNGWMMEHRLVMEQMIGRLLAGEEVVHHRNHRRADNRESNLMLFASQEEHIAYEAKEGRRGGRWARNYDCCISCGTDRAPHTSHGLCRYCYYAGRIEQHDQGGG